MRASFLFVSKFLLYYIYIFNVLKGNVMDKAYKKLGKEAKKIEKDTKKVLAKDEKRDKLVKAGKKHMKSGC